MDLGPFLQGEVCIDRALSCGESGANDMGAEGAESASSVIAHGQLEVGISQMEVLRKKNPVLSRNKGSWPSAWWTIETCVAEFGGAGGGFVLNPAVWDLGKIL